MYNRAVFCGPESGIFVLDIDPRHNGNHGLHLLLTQHSDLPPAPTVRTANGDAHFYFDPAHTTVPYSAELWGQGVQALGLHTRCRCRLHASSGHVYDWEDTRTLGQYPIPQAPSWLLLLIQQYHARSHALILRRTGNAYSQ